MPTNPAAVRIEYWPIERLREYPRNPRKKRRRGGPHAPRSANLVLRILAWFAVTARSSMGTSG